MDTARLAAFSDGVLAIIITVMVLELKIPHGASWEALQPVMPAFGNYILSFLYIGIYWNNHHHLLYTLKRSNGVVLWANLHLLFWLSLLPFATGWMAENEFATLPTAIYGLVLFFAAIAYFMLQHAIVAAEGPDSLLSKALGHNLKGIVSVAAYLVAVIATYWIPLEAHLTYIVVALLWLVPDRRIERLLEEQAPQEH